MKQRIYLLLLLLTSLIGYTEWGNHQHAYMFQVEADLLKKLFSSPKDLIHPLVILPFLGQLLLVFSFLKKGTSRWVPVTGVISLGVLLLLLLFIGILSLNSKMIICSLPYVVLAVLFFLQSRRR